MIATATTSTTTTITNGDRMVILSADKTDITTNLRTVSKVTD